MLPSFQPMPVGRSPRPFSHPDWIYEIKWEGFRSLAYLEDGHCKLVSRNGNEFKSFAALNLALPLECGAQDAVLDGEIVCLDKTGTSQFTAEVSRATTRLISCSRTARTCVTCPWQIVSTGCVAWSQQTVNGCCTVTTLRAWVRSCSILSGSAISKV